MKVNPKSLLQPLLVALALSYTKSVQPQGGSEDIDLQETTVAESDVVVGNLFYNVQLKAGGPIVEVLADEREGRMRLRMYSSLPGVTPRNSPAGQPAGFSLLLGAMGMCLVPDDELQTVKDELAKHPAE